MNETLKRCVLALSVLLIFVDADGADFAFEKTSLSLDVVSGERLEVKAAQAEALKWASADSRIAQVYGNGFVVALRPGSTKITATGAGGPLLECAVTVSKASEPIVDPAKLQQYDDNRAFTVNGRKCIGSELNGQRAVEPEERRNTRTNRVLNPHPPTPDEPREWQVEDGAEIYDGAGVLMGTVAPSRSVYGKKIPVSMFNFGMSKVIDGKLCLYAFSVPIKPAPAIQNIVDPAEMKNGALGTSAWLPLDRVVQKEELLERIGLGKVKLPHLPLEEKRYRITGGDPKQYVTEFGEMSIVKDIHAGPVPSHYLKRPSGTVNILYSVPGFGLGGQGLDSFLVSDGAIFRPAKGAKVFVQPTWFPPKHPKAGEVSPMTMTFCYGAVEVKDSEPIFGWVAKEALSPYIPSRSN